MDGTFMFPERGASVTLKGDSSVIISFPSSPVD